MCFVFSLPLTLYGQKETTKCTPYMRPPSVCFVLYGQRMFVIFCYPFYNNTLYGQRREPSVCFALYGQRREPSA